MTTFHIRSLGCKVSQYDGEKLAEKLCLLGLKSVEEHPDIFILNGCSVTSRASQKAGQIMRSVKRANPNVKIVLAGCEARLTKRNNAITQNIDWVMTHNDDLSVKQMLSALSLDIDETNSMSCTPKALTQKTRAYLKIQDGCTQFCTYCIVSRLRGPEWSRPIEDAVFEAQLLADEGHKEIVLTGIHIGHFKPSLMPLLNELEKISKIERIRLSSIEPTEVDDELIDWVASSGKSCHHFHLPLQSGCDKILKSMNRPYCTEDFRNIVKKIRAEIPNAAITTDLIVGFPGETEQDFNETMSFLKEMKFSRIHIFKFSPRDGTPAAVMPNQVNNGEKNRRSDLVQDIWHESAKEFHSKFLGQELEVLWETEENGCFSGFSKEYVPCILPENGQKLENTITTAIGLKATADHLTVEAI
jgi:threonylcarbamoyladenosine tRNA methylthiotransferase MtaB